MKVQLQPYHQGTIAPKAAGPETTSRSDSFLQAMEKLSQDFNDQRSNIEVIRGELPNRLKSMFDLQQCAQQLHLRSEIVARGAESVAGALRRLQQMS